ncbi:hypothetical protein DNTS_029717, partial [Danionella cerebrum]
MSEEEEACIGSLGRAGSSMASVEHLRVLPPDPEDSLTQRCRMGPNLMSRLHLNLGSPVLIRFREGGSCVCRAWPRRDLAEGFLQINTQCSLDVSTSSLKDGTVSVAQIKPLSCIKLSSVALRVFVHSRDGKKRVSEDTLHQILEGVFIHAGHLLDLSFTQTAVKCVLVEEVNSGSQKAGLVTLKTKVSLSSVQTVKHLESRRARESVAECLGGMGEVYSSLKEMISFPLRFPDTLREMRLSCPRGLLLIGPSGVGKTLLVRCIARDIDATLVTVNGPEVTGSRPGESEENLRRVFDQAREAGEEGPCILLIDEIDSLCPRRTESSSAPENRLVAQLLTLMDAIGSHEGFVIIGATNQPDVLDPALRRPGRFDREVVLGVPTLLQRRSILQCVCREMPLAADVDLNTVAEITCGYVGADLSALCREAALQAMRDSGAGARASVSMQHFNRALRHVQPSCLRSAIGAVEFKPISWEQIGGLEEVKLKLRQSIEWPLRFPEALLRMGVSRPRGVLLYGPPGCAKTTLVKAAASASHCSFHCISGAQLFSPYIGDSEKTLAQLFARARACAPSIVFLDEIDSMVGSRGDESCVNSVQSQVLSVLLTELDGVGFRTLERRGVGDSTTITSSGDQEDARLLEMELQETCNSDVLIVAATNRPEALDSALLRPGRLDQIIYVPPPDLQTRVNILHICSRGVPQHEDVCLEDLADQTELFSGADLENLCKEAALLALRDEGLEVSCVRQEHFLKALQILRPSLSPEQLQKNFQPYLIRAVLSRAGELAELSAAEKTTTAKLSDCSVHT